MSGIRVRTQIFAALFHFGCSIFKASSKKHGAVPKKSKTDSTAEVEPAESQAAAVWTPEDTAATKIQSLVRGRIARAELQRRKQEKEEYEALMNKLEQEVRKLNDFPQGT